MVLDFFSIEYMGEDITLIISMIEVYARVSEQAKEVDALLCKGRKERFLNQLLYIN